MSRHVEIRSSKGKKGQRSRAGCHTCRIRRKKCLQGHHSGNRCKSCVELKLECIEGTSKRPKWIVDNIQLLRDSIRDHTRKPSARSGANSVQRRMSSLALSECDDNGFLSLHNIVAMYGTSDSMPSSLPLDDHSSLESSSSSDEQDYSSLSSTNEEMLPDGSDEFFSSLLAIEGYDAPISPSDLGVDPNDNDYLPYTTPSYAAPETGIPRSRPQPYSSTWMITSMNSGAFLEHFKSTVLTLQFPFASQEDLHVIHNTVANLRSSARNNMELLSREYESRARQSGISTPTPGLADHGYQAAFTKSIDFKDRAQALLVLVSIILFAGGRGNWAVFLDNVCASIDSHLQQAGYTLDDALYLDEELRFLVGTLIRFDVIGSVTARQTPRYMEVLTRACQTSSGWVDSRTSYPSLNMYISGMACENFVALALARTSYLASCKMKCLQESRLNKALLTQNGALITEALDKLLPVDEMRNSPDYKPGRVQIARLYRLAAHLYVQSVVHDDVPGVYEVNVRVLALVAGYEEQLRDLDQKTRTQVVRSTIFPIFLGAALSATTEQFDYFVGLLSNERHGPGNSGTAADVLLNLRPMSNFSSVGGILWWSKLKEMDLLLV